MMKNKTKRIIVNGVVLAALAAVGVTAYQLGTSPVKMKSRLKVNCLRKKARQRMNL